MLYQTINLVSELSVFDHGLATLRAMLCREPFHNIFHRFLILNLLQVHPFSIRLKLRLLHLESGLQLNKLVCDLAILLLEVCIFFLQFLDLGSHLLIEEGLNPCLGYQTLILLKDVKFC